MSVTILGFVAGSLTTAAVLPQLLKVWRSKNTSSLSWGNYILSGIGLFLWLIYGILIADIPLIVFNILTLTQVLLILALKRRYG